MDIDALAQGIALLGSAADTLKKIIGMLPDNREKVEAEADLIRAERELQTAQAQIADELGYELCRNHFPPAIMLSADDEIWECSECDNRKDKSNPPLARARFRSV